MKLKYHNASEMKSHVEIKRLCETNNSNSSTTYTTIQYKSKTYYIVSDTPCFSKIHREFLKQFQVKKTVRNIIKNIPEIQIEFQEYDGEHGVFDNENHETKTDNHTIRFALYINNVVEIENIRVFSDDDKLDIQEAESEKIKRKLFKQINY